MSAATGISRHTIYRWEKGQVDNPVRDTLHALLDELGIPREEGYRALGMLPGEQLEEAVVDDNPFVDPTERKLWALENLTEGERRGLIALYRAQRDMRKSDAI